MRIGAYLLATLGMAAAANAGPAPCSLSNPGRCTDTNRLVWSKGFDSALRAFAGERRRDYLGRPMRLCDIVVQVLGGPPQKPKLLKDGGWLFAACRAHSCDEKGALIVSSRGDIRAAGIIHYRKAPMLTVMLARGGSEPALVDALLAWGRAAKPALNDVEVVHTGQPD